VFRQDDGASYRDRLDGACCWSESPDDQRRSEFRRGVARILIGEPHWRPPQNSVCGAGLCGFTPGSYLGSLTTDRTTDRQPLKGAVVCPVCLRTCPDDKRTICPLRYQPIHQALSAIASRIASRCPLVVRSTSEDKGSALVRNSVLDNGETDGNTDNTRRRVTESSIVAFGIRALTNECNRLAKEYNHGKRFDPPID
jgi:hypothetical protein